MCNAPNFDTWRKQWSQAANFILKDIYFFYRRLDFSCAACGFDSTSHPWGPHLITHHNKFNNILSVSSVCFSRSLQMFNSRVTAHAQIFSQNCETWSNRHICVFCHFSDCQRLTEHKRAHMHCFDFFNQWATWTHSQNDDNLPTILKHFQNICITQMMLNNYMSHHWMLLVTNSKFLRSFPHFVIKCHTNVLFH